MHTSSWAINFISDSHTSRYNFETFEGEGKGASPSVQALTREEKVERTLSESTKPRELNSALFLAHHLKKGSNTDTLTIDLGSGAGGISPGGPDALLALRPLEEENPWRAEPTVRYFSRIEPFGVRMKFPL
jgi:hypothetical protein